MIASTAPRVKVCGVTRPADAMLAAEAGADYVGAIMVPGSPRWVSTGQASSIAEAIPVPLVIVVADIDANAAARSAEEAGARVIQLHGEESESDIEDLRRRGEWELWKAVRVRTGEDIRAAVDRYGPWVDLVLLDAWHPTKRGGTGISFPWGELEDVRDLFIEAGLQLGVAGGLSVENVSEAVERLHPDLVDVSSGVEVAVGIKDSVKVRAFIRRAHTPIATRREED